MKKIINEFKTFIERGNVVDLAVGVVMGSAFSKIVTSVVDDLLMPIIGIIIGGHDFSNLSIKVGESTIRYGSLINNVINFFIIACCIFLLVKFITNSLFSLINLYEYLVGLTDIYTIAGFVFNIPVHATVIILLFCISPQVTITAGKGYSKVPAFHIFLPISFPHFK
mgnify:CR=1 FL=1